jgi:VanZ family protein
MLAVEVAQVFLRSHAATAVDFGMGWLGAAVGVWAGTRWRPLDARPSQASSRRPWWRWPAVAAAVLLAAGYHWQPFDFVLDESLVRQKIGSISLAPFAGYTVGNDLAALNNLISKVGVALPLGASAAWVVPTGLPRRLALVLWVAVATVVFGAIETGQFFLPTRVPDPTDVAVGVAASAVGLTAGLWLHRVER